MISFISVIKRCEYSKYFKVNQTSFQTDVDNCRKEIALTFYWFLKSIHAHILFIIIAFNMFTSETNIRVRYAETDQMGVVYHSNYFLYFESARAESI